MRLDDLDGGAGDVEETEFATVRDNLGQRPHVIEDEGERATRPYPLIGRDYVGDIVAIGTSTRAVGVERNVNAINKPGDTDEAAAWRAPHRDNIHLRRIGVDRVLDAGLVRLAGVNEEQAAKAGAPRTVLDALRAVSDAVAPRRLDAKGADRWLLPLMAAATTRGPRYCAPILQVCRYCKCVA